jgi:hypothetical protein
LHQCVLSSVNEMSAEHVDFLINDIQVWHQVVAPSFPRFLYIVIFITYSSRHVGSRPITRIATHCWISFALWPLKRKMTIASQFRYYVIWLLHYVIYYKENFEFDYNWRNNRFWKLSERLCVVRTLPLI